MDDRLNQFWIFLASDLTGADLSDVEPSPDLTTVTLGILSHLDPFQKTIFLRGVADLAYYLHKYLDD